MKKKIILLIVLIILIGAGSGVYLNRALILDKIKLAIIEKIESQIGRTVSIGKLDYSILKGIVISDFEISQNGPGTQAPFIKAKRISANPVLFPFILRKNIMIPSISIDSLSADVVRLEKNLWNFSDLIKSIPSEEKPKPKFTVTVLRIIIRNSNISFQDNTLASPFTKQLKNLNLLLKPSLPANLKFDLNANIDKPDSKIVVIGKINLPTMNIESSVDASGLLITDYLAYVDKLPLTVNNGILSAELKGSFKNGRLYLEGSNSIEKLDIEKNKLQILTDLNSQLMLKYDRTNTDKPFDYKANIDLQDAKISGLKFVNVIQNLNGKLKILPDKLSSDEIRGNFSGNSLKASGSLEDFKNPNLNLKLDSDISLAALKEIFKDKIDLSKIEIDGDSKIQLTIKGLLSEPKVLQGTMKLSDARLNANYLPGELKKIKADIKFGKNNVSWKNLTADFRGDKLTSSGSLKDFTNPQIKFDISSDSLNFTTQLNAQDKILQIVKLNGNFQDSQFDVKGTADITIAKNPLLNLKTNANIKLEDLGEFNPKLKEIVKKMKLAGTLTTQADLNGRLKDYQNWQIILKSNSAVMSLYGFKINDVVLDYHQGASKVGNLQLTGSPYAGNLLLKSQLDFINTNVPFVSEIIINDVDISKLKNDTGLKDKDIFGLLQAQTNLKGSGKKIKDLIGSGSMRIDNGNLWELKLLKGLGELLLIPEFRKIVFKEATGDFLIQNQKISTDNFMLESEPVNILLEGNIDFRGFINFTVTTQLSEGLMKDATDLKGLLNTILAQSTNAVTIKLTGTAKDPKYKILPIPTQIFKKAKDFILEDVVGSVLDGSDE